MPKFRATLFAIAVTSAFAWTQALAQSKTGLPDALNVNVTNTPLPVRDADNPARSPVQFTLCKSALSGSICATTTLSDVFNVPSGRRLVIEYISGECILANALQIGLGVTTSVEGVSVRHGIRLIPPVLGTGNLQVAQPTLIYADPGTAVAPGMGGQFTGVDCLLSFSGHTVAVP